MSAIIVALFAAFAAMLYTFAGTIATAACTSILGGLYLCRCLKFVARDEQLFVEELTELRVINGAATILLPLSHKRSYKRKAPSLAPSEYCIVRNSLTGQRRVEQGPMLLFLNPYDEMEGAKKTAISLRATEFVRFLNKQTGQVRVEVGEQGNVIPSVDEVFLDSQGVRNAISLKSSEYVKIEDGRTGAHRLEIGEKLVFLGPFEEIVGNKLQVISLKATEFVRFLDKQTGQVRVEVGEQGKVVPTVDEVLLDGQVRSAIPLKSSEYVKIENQKTGAIRVERGEKLVFLGPFEEVVGSVQTAISLKATEFVRFLDKQTGVVRVEVGEQGNVVPTADEVLLDGEVRSAIPLKCFEYVKIENKKTGAIKVERGEKLVFLGPYEEFIGSVQKAIEVDDETAVLIRNKRTGQQHLVTEKQIFIPGDDDEILESRKLIKLADYEACIVRGKDGTDTFFFGKNPDQRSFFLPPHSSLVELLWSRGRRREFRDLRLKKIDLRPMFMSFEFNCRTADNVELILEGTFFWEVVDLQAMLKFTCDTTGDVCNHARSKFIERVSRVTLQQFMADFNNIAELVHKEDDGFYSQRGVLIHSLEVSGYRCAETSTAMILEQIIQETTNRMNRLQQQESENEVQLFQIKGLIEEERAKKELLEAQIDNSNARSSMEGLSEATRVRSFLEGLEANVPDIDRRIALWNVLRKKDALQAVCANGSRLYYTPNDVNLSIEDRSGAVGATGTDSDSYVGA